MSKHTSLVICFILASLRQVAQVPVTTGSYVQDFGTADVTSWVNNSTYPGWYQSQGSLAGHVNMTNAAPLNTGGFYTYECNGLNDQKIGSRSSGSATLVRYGVVLRNQTGFPIRSLRVRYRGYQMSLAQNGNAVNRTAFDYVVSSAVPSIGAIATAAVPSLNFTQLQNNAVAGSNQINGYPCTQSALISGCIALATPLANGNYILLRWSDPDDPNNDHHMAIDDVQVDFDLTGSGCAVLLPVELVQFTARPEAKEVRLEWITASEHDNDHFVVERSMDGTLFESIGVVPGAGNSAQPTTYSTTDVFPLAGLSYYRLRQVDRSGTWDLSSMVVVERDVKDRLLSVVPSVSSDGQVLVLANNVLVNGHFEVLDASGRHLFNDRLTSPSYALDLRTYGAGWYVLRVQKGATVGIARIIVTLQ